MAEEELRRMTTPEVDCGRMAEEVSWDYSSASASQGPMIHVGAGADFAMIVNREGAEVVGPGTNQTPEVLAQTEVVSQKYVQICLFSLPVRC